MYTIKVKCPKCGRDRNFCPKSLDKEKWTATCFFCGKSFKIYPKNAGARVV